MMRFGVVAAFTMFAAASVFGQGQTFEPAIPKGLPESRVEPSGELPESAPVPPRLEMNAMRAQSDADARQCLEMASNVQIHRCAERYRSRAARATATRIARTPTPVGSSGSQQTSEAAEAARSADTKPSITAKTTELSKRVPKSCITGDEPSCPNEAAPVKPK